MREKLRSILVQGWRWTRNQDLVVLLLACALVTSAWVFLALADEVSEGETDAFDRAVLRAFRTPGDLNDPLGPRRVEEGVRDITALGSVTVLSIISSVVAGFLVFTRRYSALLLLASALAGGSILNWTLKNYFNRARPEFVTQLHHVDSYSFPSGHSLLAAVVYLTLGALVARLVASRRQKIYILSVAVLLTFLVGVSRIYLGVHYPSDVLAGWSVGLLWAILCWLIARHLQRRGKIERPTGTSAQTDSFARTRADH